MDKFTLSREANLLLACTRTYCDPSYGLEPIIHTCRQVDWERLSDLARRHNLLPVVSARLMDRCFSDVIPEDSRILFKKSLYATICHDAQFRAWMNHVLDKLSTAGVCPIVLKGPVLADYLYPTTYLRLSGDLDLLIHPQDIVAAGTALLDNGYKVTHHLPAAVDELEGIDLSALNDGSIPISTPEFSRRHDYHISLEGTIDGKQRLVELHWKPAPARSANLPTEEIWVQAASIEINGRKAYALAPEHQLCLLLFHMINHGWGDGSLRNLLDLSLMTTSWPEMDWDEITRLCRNQTARGHAYHVLTWMGEHMGASVPDETLSALRPTPYERWSSRPYRSFQDVVSLEKSQHSSRRDFADGWAECASIGDKAMFLLGMTFPSIDGLAQMRGMPTGWRLYLSYLYRPIAVGLRLIARRIRPVKAYPVATSHEPKTLLSDRSMLFRILERINALGASMRSKPGLSATLGRAINFSCARGFDLCTLGLLACRRLLSPVDVTKIATEQTADASSCTERANDLCRYVFVEVAYARSITWLDPADTLRLGYGDCKCQARLLQELLAAIGIEGRVVVGITGRRAGVSKIHAWVEAHVDGRTMICDPTLCPRALEPDEYDQRTGGILDVTPEYALKRFGARIGAQPGE